MPQLRGVRAPLLRWYRAHRRDLPWRRTRDPYAIWVSEVMLQQTRVATVLPYYRRFLDRFPDVDSLARADEDEVLSVWAGLGYYRRARGLLAGARLVATRHGGRMPREPEELLALPGVGRYTAGAIASIAYDLPQPVVDGNVRRVLSRLLAAERATERELWAVAASLVHGAHPGDLNQALMELGATLCTARAPSCPRCPLRRRCRAQALGLAESLPAPRPRPATLEARVAVAWIARPGRVLLARHDGETPLRGSWDLPAAELGRDDLPRHSIDDRIARPHRLEVRVGDPLARLTHGIMNRRLQLVVYDCRLRRGRIAGSDALRWVPFDRLGDVPISGATRKVVRALRPDP